MSEREIKCRRVSGRQLEILWEFLNSHRGIAAAFNRSLAAKAYSESKWREVAEQLNAEVGAFKDWKLWSKYWVDYKGKLKKKAALNCTIKNKTGGGPPTEPLSLIEAKFLEILGPDFGQGLPGIQVEQLPQPSGSSLVGSSIQMSVTTTHSHTPRKTPPPSPTSIVTHIPMSTPTPTPTDRPTHAHTPSHTGYTYTHADLTSGHSPRRRRRRREPPMSQESARSRLVQSSQMRAEATVRCSRALELIGQTLVEMTKIMQQGINKN